jgi:phospholipase/carboxylesterase
MILGGTRAAAAILDGYLDAQLKAREFDESKLALVGFSQGTMMSLHVGPRRAVAPAAIVGYSGRLIAAELLASEATSKPAVLLVHGTADPMVPFASMAAAETSLREAGIAVETLARPGLPHSIDQEGLGRGAQFLKQHLA